MNAFQSCHSWKWLPTDTCMNDKYLFFFCFKSRAINFVIWCDRQAYELKKKINKKIGSFFVVILNTLSELAIHSVNWIFANVDFFFICKKSTICFISEPVIRIKRSSRSTHIAYFYCTHSKRWHELYRIFNMTLFLYHISQLWCVFFCFIALLILVIALRTSFFLFFFRRFSSFISPCLFYSLFIFTF